MDSISPDNPQKQCPKCGKLRPLKAFSRQRHNKHEDGTHLWCKTCKRRRYNKQYNDTHREEIRAQHKEYHQAHKEEENKRSKKYHHEHKDEARERSRQYKQAHKEELRIYLKKYRQEHCEELLQYRQERGEELKAYMRGYRQSDRGRAVSKSAWHRRRVLERDAKGSHTSQQLYEQLQRQKSHCYYCKTKLASYGILIILCL